MFKPVLIYSLLQSARHFAEFILAVDLDTEVIDPALVTARRNREIDPGIVEHPLGVVLFHDRWSDVEQRIIKGDRRVEVGYREADVQAFHGKSPVRLGWQQSGARLACWGWIDA